MSDRTLARAAMAALLVVDLIAAVVSFIHIQHYALTHGQTELAANLLPFSIDGAVAASSLTLLRAARLHITAPWLAQAMLGLSVLATLAANVAYGAAFGLAGSLISGWPAVAFIGCTEVAITMARRTVRNRQEPSEATPAGNSMEAARQALAASVAAGYPRSAHSLHKDFGIPRTDATELVRATQNGHAE
jgi:hypothetical protein